MAKSFSLDAVSNLSSFLLISAAKAAVNILWMSDSGFATSYGFLPSPLDIETDALNCKRSNTISYQTDWNYL